MIADDAPVPPTPSRPAPGAHSAARTLAESLFAAAVRGADPYDATERALDRSALGIAVGARPWIIATGKAAAPMARATIDVLASVERIVEGGLVVTSDTGATAHPLPVIVGDHPLPGAGSGHAADAVLRLLPLIQPGDDVFVLLSGGASSLMAAPVEGIPEAAMLALFQGLHRSGAPIAVMNAFRKRVMRWGGGRLGAALGGAGARVTCLIASDVIGDDPASIASGPCSADRHSAADLIELAQQQRLWPAIPDPVRTYLDHTLTGEVPETPKLGSETLRGIEPRIILGNADALDAAQAAARGLGITVRVAPTPITGAARSTGDAIARAAVVARASLPGRPTPAGPLTTPCRLALMWGGETTVALGATPGVGGRAQELALAAARALHDAGAEGRGITILSAGTDGRDGPSDAAGAIVDARTWARIALSARSPERDLATHDAHPALDAAGALLRTGMTGTNVNDVVIALIE
ncbi:MAG: DUF4147 domain-containing protein [Gemmatimonadaceae bacterium]|nr:DUF4147 domain-containing protein [Gemmatimonadaceae bacterium]